MTSSASSLSSVSVQLPHYDLVETLYNGSHTTVYRALKKKSAQPVVISEQPVVIKVLNQEYPSFNELVQFRNQYTIAKNLNLPGIVQPLSLEPLGNGYALIMEDWGGISLSQYLQHQSLQWEEVLAIALQLATILHDLHLHRVIHKDIKPANILMHPESKQVKLIDFSIASLLPKETQEIQNPNILEGTLAYLAPEQTGRMNRGIDYRADFYALGVTLYQLLSGQLPFASDDPMELVHCHIAKLAVSVDQVNPAVPGMVAAIVAKLMAKNAEDRYQSALGLQHDLQQCLTQWQATGAIAEFKLGQQDLSDRFLIPEKLYGREAEVQTLLNAFERVAQGASELMLVAGFSGIGKTAVVNEVHKPITRQQGYFIKGKFDQFNRNIPLSAFVQALRDLMGQLLSESQAQLAEWKVQILEAVGENGQVLIEVIPELEQIIGAQPAIAKLSGTAAQNRFNLLFQKFIQVFTTTHHPLVIFIDDLQWADLASLQLMKLLMQDHGYLLMLGAYRDNEVSPAHPLMLTLEELKTVGTIVNTITLAPLALEQTNRLIADTLQCDRTVAQPLTQLVDRKTQGNPFFTTQFLKALHEDGCITFNLDQGYWQCDMAQVNALALTDDVVEFMALQLQKLPEETQSVLKLAACVGNQFDLATLAIVAEQAPTEAATALWKALQEGLIIPTTQVYKFFQVEARTLSDVQNSINPVYRFLHDRIQQAAYSLIPAEQKAVTHWQIGQLLWQDLLQHPQAQPSGDKIFDIVNHLNLGKQTISLPAQQHQLAQLNLQAGEKAKLSTAYQAAQTYCQIGIELLPTNAWETDYALVYALHRHGAEAAYLSSDFDRAEALYQVALAQAQNPLDQAVIYRVQMTQYQLQGRNAEAIAIQRQSLELLGWSIPQEPESIQHCLDAEIASVEQFLQQQTIESILELPKMVDAVIAEQLRILQILFYAAWLAGQPTLALLALAKMTTLSLQYGNSDMSPFGYVGYGLIANALLKNATQAYQFGNMAVQLCEQFDNADVRGMTNFLFAADVHSWKRPLREADRYYEDAYKYGMEAGNWLTVGFMMMQSGSDRLTYGKNLEDLYAIAQAHAAFLHQIKSLENLDALTVGVLQPIRQLLGLTQTPFTFDDTHFREAEYLQKYCNTPYHLAWFYSVKIRHAYLFDQPDTYSGLIPHLSIIEATIPSHAKVPSSVFYVVLMHLVLLEQPPDETQQQGHWQSILPLEERLNHWQQDCPENIRHKCLLIQAEKARIHGYKAEAIDLYDHAIVSAKENGYLQEEALANELAAKFYLGWGKEKVAAGYLQEAYYGYARWGASAKVADLEKRYPQLLQPILQTNQQPLTVLETLASIAAPAYSLHSTSSKSSTRSNINHTFDFVTLLQVSQTLASTIELNELMQTLTQKMIENSGADQCTLILCEDNQWQVRVMANLEQVILQSVPLEDNPSVPVKLIQYVKHSLTTVAIDDLKTDLPVIGDYLHHHQPKSVLCLPILNQGNLRAIVYLENRSTSGVFTNDRILILNVLCTQAAISLENAQLYQKAQRYAQQLEQSQLQIVQSEKMASLGNLVAGVAHEINNPIGFLNGSINNAQDYVQDLLDYIALYQQHHPQAASPVQEKADDIDLEFLTEDLPKLLNSMQGASDRIKGISTSLRTFSRADTEHKVRANLHEGLDSTLLILKYRLKANEFRPAIEVIQDYGNLPEINCFPGQLNQVFMNILANAIDMFDEMAQTQSFNALQANPQKITIRTTTDSNQIQIQISDNGKGMTETVKSRIFDHLFTTKGVGKGTGLGLAIARQIVEKKHGGKIFCTSTLGLGTTFMVKIPQS
ncbi:ATP-binding sensor histidine kinase [Alkalinema sp. FACHB-956]|uniref:trifunctional serine/threonine-protein kinase/ATP-binding protein/sensor histidine kinase n=1 Tax=Alkalinema sp. FACHB-956 TaxID=2692768 RepID=UPI001682C3EA|nr:ATP-binding sensor histidine kinase [Alkalinema sp. FACHB-956]MBD2329849.1 AAA family ATPase [Alkalinema sp. FACHB-956]